MQNKITHKGKNWKKSSKGHWYTHFRCHTGIMTQLIEIWNDVFDGEDTCLEYLRSLLQSLGVYFDGEIVAISHRFTQVTAEMKIEVSAVRYNHERKKK